MVRSARTFLFALILLVVYLASTVPVGMFIYSVKSDAGIDIFRTTGFHGYMQCLREEAYEAKILQKQKQIREKSDKDQELATVPPTSGDPNI